MKFFLMSAVGLALVAWAGSAQAADGAAVWKANKCQMCHGEAGKADTKIGKAKKIRDMTTAEWQKAVSDDAIKKSIKEGVDRKTDGTTQKMKAYPKLKAEEVDALIKLIRSWAPKS